MSESQQVPQQEPTPAVPPSSKKKFYPTICTPYESFTGNKPTPIPFLVDGLLTKSGFSVLSAKGKHGKSSWARFIAVAVAKGQPIFDRPVEQGEVLLCSLEDPSIHVDNCLHVLGYDLKKDARIYPVYKLSRNFSETIDFVNDTLAKFPAIKFVVLDTLGKVIRAKKIEDYNEMLPLCENLFDMSEQLKVHIQALGHCKKVLPDDPFDSFMGSAEVRNSTHTNIVIFDRNGRRWIQSETKMGTPWDATELSAELCEVDGSQMVKRFYLGQSQENIEEQKQSANTKIKADSAESELISFLRERGGRAPYAEYMKLCHGRAEKKRDTVQSLKKRKVVRITGVEKSPVNPQILHIVNPPAVVASIKEQLQKAEEQLQRAKDLVVDRQQAKEKCIRDGYGDGTSWNPRIEEEQARVTAAEVRVAELKQMETQETL